MIIFGMEMFEYQHDDLVRSGGSRRVLENSADQEPGRLIKTLEAKRQELETTMTPMTIHDRKAIIDIFNYYVECSWPKGAH